ncbi:class F sortase [Rudaeicoccus suwonensis]|uniref:Sortase family protein n=1 Tax=Rudaeicoccus suwonensis TaxID=657409 RepID=A0A561E6N4_9MICO|nr:class F sortase [Rudaeicoccus suwonensis]TWE11283.1 sortase family protein [Rudaeicoccus suwonensis]
MTQHDGKNRQTRSGSVVVTIGVAVALVGTGAMYLGLRGDTNSPTDSGTNFTATPPNGSTSGSSSAGVVPNPTSHSTPLAANPAGAACIPDHLTVSSVGINEKVIAMGTNAQGQIYPPAHTTMWYDKSTQPGQDGIAVIAGHVTYDGPDNFYHLRNTAIGASVVVSCSNGKVVNLVVTSEQSVPKTQLTTDQRVWGGSSTPVVTLITCDIDSPMIDGHHLNNYVVWTKPA